MYKLKFEEKEHIYTVDGCVVPSVTQLIKLVGLGTTFNNVSPELLEYARSKGVAVHKACELDTQGTLDISTVDEIILPYLRAWQLFRKECSFDPLYSEVMLYHKDLKFAGTIDCIGKLFGKLAVVDIKTGSVTDSAKYQTAAYKELANNNFVEPVIDRYIVKLNKTGDYQLTNFKDDMDWIVFIQKIKSLQGE